ncbi:hypothetical protein AB4254_10945 [Vibrio breoganii]
MLTTVETTSNTLENTPNILEMNEHRYACLSPECHVYFETSLMLNASESQTIFDSSAVWRLNLSSCGTELQILKGILHSSTHDFNDDCLILWEEFSMSSMPAVFGVSETIINSPACNNVADLFGALWVASNKRFMEDRKTMSVSDTLTRIYEWLDCEVDRIERENPVKYNEWIARCA